MGQQNCIDTIEKIASIHVISMAEQEIVLYVLNAIIWRAQGAQNYA